MILQQERELIVEYGKKMINENLSKGTFGNISIYNSEKGLMAISPSGLDYFMTEPADIVIMDLEGNKVDGERKPSSETDLHRIFYQRRKGIKAAVHTHSEYATVLSCLNISIPPVHYIAACAGKNIHCTEYIQFGTQALAKRAYEVMEDNYACLLGNHGLMAVGRNIEQAFEVAQQVEFLAMIYCRAKALGEPVVLNDRQMNDTLKAFKGYRQQQ